MKNLRKQAQSLIEYGLILALVAIVALTVLTKLSSSVSKTGDNAVNAVDGANTNAMNDYCAGIKAGSTYNQTTKKCS
jgi:Flp pilus assembly pilin Flp